MAARHCFVRYRIAVEGIRMLLDGTVRQVTLAAREGDRDKDK